MRTIIAVLALASSAVSAAPDARRTTVPIAIQQSFGWRPTVRVRINGRPFTMVVHSSAGSHVQLPHDGAARAGVTALVHVGAYGISRSGEVSGLGRDKGVISDLRVGTHRAHDIPVSVFEAPAKGVDGMLGIPWLRANNVVIDYATRTLSLGDGPASDASLRRTLAGKGYSAIPMTIVGDKDARFVVSVTIGNVTRPMVVSTVAAVVLDQGFASAAGVRADKDAGEWGSPTGATGKVRSTTSPLPVRLGGFAASPIVGASVFDLKAYMADGKAAVADDLSNGMLGGDFMIANRAVIDFGNRVLYIRPAVIGARPVVRQ